VSTAARISVGIATRARPESLVRCVASLACLGELLDEVIVVDDGSPVPVEPALRGGLSNAMRAKVRVIRFDPQQGTAAARTTCVRAARSPWVLNLDDDTEMLSADAVQTAVRTIGADPSIFAIAFAQATADGDPLPPAAQPGRADRPCYVTCYIGFAHLVRRDAFLALGGYRAALIIYGEEREICLRALDAGWHVVYLPDARIAHLADPAGRDMRRYLHLTVRNGVLSSIYNDPLPLLMVRVPMRLAAYFRMRSGWKVQDPGGFLTILGWIWRDLGGALKQRRAVRWATIGRWRRLNREMLLYRGPA